MDKVGSLSAGQAVTMAEFFLSLSDDCRFVFEATSEEAGSGDKAGAKPNDQEDAGKGKGKKGKGRKAKKGKKATKVMVTIWSCVRANNFL
jgi:hypothetical protein